MVNPPLKAVIEACDRAISQEDYDTLMDYYAEDALLVVAGTGGERQGEHPQSLSRHCRLFQHRLVVTQGKMEILEGGDTALVIMETRLDIPTAEGNHQVTRRATYVFRRRSSAGCVP
jgi:ketosteroid isomerase-like protein